jgi:hypothetical protein
LFPGRTTPIRTALHLNFILHLPSNADENSLAAAHARLE